MPELKCEYGHTQRINADEWIKQLTLDQLRYARQQIDEKIATAEQLPRRTVWCVDGGLTIDGWYREEDYEQAADHLLRIYKKRFVMQAKDFKGGPGSIHDFRQTIPSLEPIRVTQLEYDTEYFPEQKSVVPPGATRSDT